MNFRAYDQSASVHDAAARSEVSGVFPLLCRRRRTRSTSVQYDPSLPMHERYVRNAPPVDARLIERVEKDLRPLCRALGTPEHC